MPLANPSSQTSSSSSAPTELLMLLSLSPTTVSFLAGFLSASVAYYVLGKVAPSSSSSSSRKSDDDVIVVDKNDNNNNSKHRPTPLFRWMSTMEEIKCQLEEQIPESLRRGLDDYYKRHIGELPSNSTARGRSRWPWDRKKPSSRSTSPQQQQQQQQQDSTEASDAASTTSTAAETPKSDFCIGSIFGLDVGGTLAKLVYFEQRPEYPSSAVGTTPTARERLYRASASAQAVLLARRGTTTTSPKSSSPKGNALSSHSDHNNLPTSFDDSSIRSPTPPWRPHNPPGLKATVSTSAIESTMRTTTTTAATTTTDQSSATRSLYQSARASEPSINGHPSSLYAGNGTKTASEEPIPKHYHSAASNADIQALYRLRQESLPDDLTAYEDMLHPLPHFHYQAREFALKKAEKGKNNNNSKDASDAAAASDMRRSTSMFDFSKSRTEALDRFYNFARRLDTYREGVKDEQLKFYSRQLGGEFHFIRFETRRMQNAMDLIRANQLHLNIREMGATGGGAHKYANQWQDELGIEMQKQDELDSLVAGMQFVLSTVVGECYTFRPMDGGKPTAPSREASWDEREAAKSKQKNNSSNKNNGASPSSSSSAVTTAATNVVEKDPNNPKELRRAGEGGGHGSTASTGSSSHPIGAPLEDDDDQDIFAPQNNNKQSAQASVLELSGSWRSDEDDEDSASSRGEGGGVGGAKSSSSTQGGRNDRGKGDDWWWSRKVQRDTISESSTYPYLLVTIGTGVSILRVDGPRKQERISGSTIGGGTYWGLIRLLTNCENFEDVMELAERGDPTKVDMMVGDIYGEKSDALEKVGLSANLVASSFGKLISKEDPAAGLKEEDLARALLLMITINIGQVAYLNAQLHKTSRIYFVGNFLRQNLLSQKRLSFAIDYWSKGQMEALFLEHEGYFGALGAFLLSQGIPHSSERSLKSQLSMPPEVYHQRRTTLYG